MLFTPQRIAVVGAGMAGAGLAHRLHQAGHSVHVFDKARGAGGRLATRVLREPPDPHWLGAAFDHGAPGFSAQSAAFRDFLSDAAQRGWVQAWTPRRHPASTPPTGAHAVQWLPTPDMPALCRALLSGLPQHLGSPVTQLQRTPQGWSLAGPASAQALRFDTVLLAIPPAQAAPLLAPHALELATRVAARPMDPGWTLMALSEPLPSSTPDWDAWQLDHPVMQSVWRQEGRPGRDHSPGLQRWVVQSRADWAAEHLEADSEWVCAQLQESLSQALGHALRWRNASAHRWRYASPSACEPADSPVSWWADSADLGVCGDAYPARSDDHGDTLAGVERAWLSGQVMAEQWLARRGAATA